MKIAHASEGYASRRVLTSDMLDYLTNTGLGLEDTQKITASDSEIQIFSFFLSHSLLYSFRKKKI